MHQAQPHKQSRRGYIDRAPYGISSLYMGYTHEHHSLSLLPCDFKEPQISAVHIFLGKGERVTGLGGRQNDMNQNKDHKLRSRDTMVLLLR